MATDRRTGSVGVNADYTGPHPDTRTSSTGVNVDYTVPHPDTRTSTVGANVDYTVPHPDTRVATVGIMVDYFDAVLLNETYAVGESVGIAVAWSDSVAFSDPSVGGVNNNGRDDSLVFGESPAAGATVGDTTGLALTEKAGFSYTDTAAGTLDDTTTSIAVTNPIVDADTSSLTESGPHPAIGVREGDVLSETSSVSAGAADTDTPSLTDVPGFRVAASDPVAQSEAVVAGETQRDSMAIVLAEGPPIPAAAVGNTATISLGESSFISLQIVATDAIVQAETALVVRVVTETIAFSDGTTQIVTGIGNLDIHGFDLANVVQFGDLATFADVDRHTELDGTGVFSINGHTPQPSQITWVPMPEVGTFLSGKPLRQGRPGLTATWPMLSYAAMAVLTSLWNQTNPFVTLQVPDPRSGQIVHYRAVMNRPVFQSRSTVYFMGVTCTFDWLTPLTTTTGHPTAPNYP